MDFPRSVTIFGTGLMGTSFALALKRRWPTVRIHGVDKPEVLERARHLGAIDPGEPQDSDLVVLAAPIGEILKLIDGMSPGPQLVLDLGSTKVDICRRAEVRGLPFVGSHPMTGSEKSGPEAASAELFTGAPFFLCTVSTTPSGALDKVQKIAEAIGSRPCVISPEDHDRLVAELSHLPQLLSTLLADHTAEHRDLAGPGLRSVTRLAGSPFDVWSDILKTSEFVPHELKKYIARLQEVLDALESGNVEQIRATFERANRSVSGGIGRLP